MQPNSSALQLVESYPPCGENYSKALEALKSRFARDDILIETYVRGLLALTLKQNSIILSTLYDNLQTHLQALETLGVNKDKYAIILFPLVESAIPDDILRAWNRHRADGANTNNLTNLVSFLKLEVVSEERIALAHQGTDFTSEPKTPTCCFVAETNTDKPKAPILCIWCDKDTHSSAECHKAANMSLQQRLEHIKAKKACSICLRTNHPTKKCRSFPKCLICKKRHTTLLCPQTVDKVEDEKASNLHCVMKSTTLLQTIVVQVVSEFNNNAVHIRALIDSGAQRSYIRKDLVHQLKLIPVRKEVLTHCLFGGKEEKREERAVYDINIRSLCNDFKCQMSVVEQSNICSFLPKICSKNLIEQLNYKGTTLTESTDSPDDVKLLIGADFSGILMTGDIVHLHNGLTAVRLKLGWTIQGPITGIYSSVASMTTTLHCLSKIDISDLLCLETLGIRDPAEQNTTTQHDARILKEFEDTISTNREGRYEVCLPWRDVPRPQSNFQVAKRRLSCTTNRLQQLGIVWNIEEDTLRCNADSLKSSNETLTKRTLLSVTQRVFDPIGYTCATTIIPKMIIQKTWAMNLTCDYKLPAELATEFKLRLDQAYLINECTIPRRLTMISSDKCENSLHVFSDASKDAYAVCIFLRSKYHDHVELRLVQAKARVTPVSKMHKITIPRLELIAATLGTRLAKMVIDTLESYNCSIYYWTDSSVVLTWIKGNGNWSIFVTNRIKEIKMSTSTLNWRHIPGNLNPADLPSRGISPKGLLENRWWEGPDWLRLEEHDWPIASFETDLKEVERERTTAANSVLSADDCFLSRLSYFSFYSKIVRMIGWILRFKKKPLSYSRELTYEEFEYAEFTLIKLIQTKHQDIMKTKNLQMFTDDGGIIRLVTKLCLGSESSDYKCPIVLPASETIVQRMVHQRHVVLLHAGVRVLMNSLRERFWIIGLRRLCRKVVDNCVKCKRFKANSCQPPTGSLPIGRMEAKAAFEISGVDLAGPLLLKSGNKSWIVLFTCATYRAVHLEVVEALTTAEFLMALRRFIARRGRVSCIYSDNATNFRGLDNAFNSLNWNEILCFSSISRIKWNFLSPSAPWWGGFYERLIDVVKDGLRRVLGRASVSLTELNTVLCDCEATINSRPLTYMSNSLDELRPLTPSMFIQPHVQHDVADLDEINRETLNFRANYCQTLIFVDVLGVNISVPWCKI